MKIIYRFLTLCFLLLTLLMCNSTKIEKDYSKLNWKKAGHTQIYGRLETLDPPIIQGKDGAYYIIHNEHNFDFFKYKKQFLIITGKVIPNTKENSFILNPEKVEPLSEEFKTILPKQSELSTEEEIIITGLIENNDEPIIIADWDSRSRVSYTVKGLHKQYLETQTGHYVEVKGIVLFNDKSNPWKKELLVTEIISITESPPKN